MGLVQVALASAAIGWGLLGRGDEEIDGPASGAPAAEAL